MSLGIPSVLCIEYPWYSALDPELRNWLFLPDFRIQTQWKNDLLRLRCPFPCL